MAQSVSVLAVMQVGSVRMTLHCSAYIRAETVKGLHLSVFTGQIKLGRQNLCIYLVTATRLPDLGYMSGAKAIRRIANKV